MTGHGNGLAVLELADARTEHERAGQSGDAAHGVHDAGAGEVDVADAQVSRVPQLVEPAAAPCPGAEQRVVEATAEEAPHHEALPLPPLGHGPRRDGRGGVHERDHVKEEPEERGADVLAAQGEAALPEEDPVVGTDEGGVGSARRGAEAEVEAGQVVGEPAEHEGVADQEEGDEADAEDGEVRRHDVGGVLGAAEAGLDQGEAGLHEDDEDGTDDDPEQVDLLAEKGDRFSFLLRAGHAGHDQGGDAGDADGGEELALHPLPPSLVEHICRIPFVARGTGCRCKAAGRRCLTCS